MDITTIIRKVVFNNKENGYTIFSTEEGTFVGNAINPTALEKEKVSFSGEWIEDKKYGKQFKFESYELSTSNLVFYLTKIVKAVSSKIANELIDKYGEEGLTHILNTNPDALKSHKGIKEKKLGKIKSKWDSFKGIQELGMLLSPFGVGAGVLLDIYKTFHGDTEEPSLFETKQTASDKIRENPYILTAVSGIGFKKADKIALGLGMKSDSPKRIGACIDYVIKQYCEQQGNSCVELSVLYKLLKEELNDGSEALYKSVISSRINSEDLVLLSDTKITTKSYNDIEEKIYTYCEKKRKEKRAPFITDIEGFISQRESEIGIKLNEKQKEAVKLANTSNILVLTGYAGTGKSTSSKMILDIIGTKFNKEDIVCTALSGIASQRIRDLTGYPSYTLQSLLIQQEMGGFSYKVILLDEASMVNSMLFYRAIKLVPENGILIIVGDSGQLQPIGAGNPLNDIIALDIAPVVQLTEIYRQKPEQAINFIANDVRQGIMPQVDGGYSDFRFNDISIPNMFKLRNTLSEKDMKELRDRNYNKILDDIMARAEDEKKQIEEYRASKNIKKFVTHFQVISPMRIGVLGTDNLNILLQNVFNPHSKQKVRTNKQELRLGDKILHIKNKNLVCYPPDNFMTGSEQRIFNGMMGILHKIDEEEELLWVFYPNENVMVEYDFDDADNLLALGYSISIHKSQGMEYSKVVIPIAGAHFTMLNNKLLYTAITRAKDFCYMVGEKYMLKSGCEKTDSVIRDTVLANKMMW